MTYDHTDALRSPMMRPEERDMGLNNVRELVTQHKKRLPQEAELRRFFLRLLTEMPNG